MEHKFFNLISYIPCIMVTAYFVSNEALVLFEDKTNFVVKVHMGVKKLAQTLPGRTLCQLLCKAVARDRSGGIRN